MGNFSTFLRFVTHTKLRRALLVLVVAGLVIFAAAPSVSNAQVTAGAATAGFGAAFGYAQRIGGVTFTQAGSIGNGTGFGIAVAPGSSSAASAVLSGGNAAAFAQAMGTPFGSAAWVQTAAFFGGNAAAVAAAAP
ncbi:MAG: hypothetical protein IT324_03645 [Anaerolineae bacterium]|nr:hypothetical protein [Anaerolineae bacterium]